MLPLVVEVVEVVEVLVELVELVELEPPLPVPEAALEGPEPLAPPP